MAALRRFQFPVAGRDGRPNALAGKTVVISGIFPEVCACISEGGGSATTRQHSSDIAERIKCIPRRFARKWLTRLRIIGVNARYEGIEEGVGLSTYG